ncbi:MAG: Spy/CpxP family protein refolding chaperone [Ignavibacteriaceae bacterium]|nr:Spy/CpxP family protein refolding chaperone [Ignavibacteriaceae bacterium]
MKRFVMTGMALLLVILFAGNAEAQRRSGYGRQVMADELNLSDTQKDQIDGLRSKHDKAMIDLRADLQKGMLEQRELMRSGNIQKDKYLAAVEKTNKIREKMALERANHRMDVYGLLDKDQKEKFDSFVGNRSNFGEGRAFKKGGRGRFGGPGAGYGGRGFGPCW